MSLDELKLKIKEEIPISSIIGHYVPLKRSGTALLGLCPFHGDSKPSMNVNDSRKMFKCFACGAGGDAITFVQKIKNVDFVDALKDICQKSGINFESYQEQKKSNPKFEMGKKILTKAAQLYRKTAATHKFSPYEEFITKRGLNEEIATIYTLGFAQNKNALYDYLKTIPDEKERTFALSIAEELGLIKRDKHNSESHYDTFRDRIIFPIWDQFGQVIGFTSRAIRDDQKAKYMNSAESFLFKKNELLYGLHLAKNAIREKDAVILVEGNMDQIALYNNGFLNTVACMGTAITMFHIERLSSMTKTIYLALDSDAAGLKAMERANSMLAEKGIVAKYIEFSPQKDPDEFLKAQGVLAMQEKIDNAVPAFDILLSKLLPEKLPEVLDRKLELLTKAFEVLAPLKSHLAATERAVAFAKRLGLRSEASQIVKNYQDYLSTIEAKEKAVARFQVKPQVVSKAMEDEMMADEAFLEGEFASVEFSEHKLQCHTANEPKKNLSKTEKLIVQELVQLPVLFSENALTELLDLVTSDEVKKYIEKIKKTILEIDESEYASVVLNLTSSPEYSSGLKEAASSALYNYRIKDLDAKTKSRIFSDLKLKLQMAQLKTKKEELKKLQQICQTDDEMTKILQELSEIEKKLQALKKNK